MISWSQCMLENMLMRLDPATRGTKIFKVCKH